jgi:hypothetical protein
MIDAIRIAIAALAFVALPAAAVAQVPPHAPGTICLTPQFWCWATLPGQPGEKCSCPGPDGQPVMGTLS